MRLSTEHLLETQQNLLANERRSTFPISTTLFGAISASAIFFSWQGDYVTASAIVLVGVALRSGYHAGAATFAGLLAGGALAMVVAGPTGKVVEPIFANWFGTQGLNNRLLSVATVGVSLVFMVTLVVRFAVKRSVANQPKLQSWNRWLGLTCGGIQGGLLVLFLVGGVMIIEPLARDELLIRRRHDRDMGRLVSEQVVMIADSTRGGKLGPVIAQYNPFDHIGVLTHVRTGVELLRTPATLQTITHRPAVAALADRPEVQVAARELREDPQLHDILTPGKTINGKTLSSLMTHPAILRLLDDREFVQELMQALGDIDPKTLLTSTSQP